MNIVQLELRLTLFYYDAVKIIKKTIKQYFLHCFFEFILKLTFCFMHILLIYKEK